MSVKNRAVLVWLEGPDQTGCVHPGSRAPLGFSCPASYENGGSGFHWVSSSVNTHNDTCVAGPE